MAISLGIYPTFSDKPICWMTCGWFVVVIQFDLNLPCGWYVVLHSGYLYSTIKFLEEVWGLGTNVHPAGRSKATAVRFPDHLANRFCADYSENGDESWQIHQQHQQVIAKHWSANLQQMCLQENRENLQEDLLCDAKIAKTYGFQLVFLKRSRKANPSKWFTSFVYPPFAPPRQHGTAQLLP